MFKSNDNLVNYGRCLENLGKEYIVYQEVAKPFELDIPKLPKSFSAVWFQPLTGEYLEVEKLKSGKNELIPPSKWGKVPVFLHVKKK